MQETEYKRKRTARAVLTGMCYSAGSAMRHGSSSLTRLTGQSGYGRRVGSLAAAACHGLKLPL
nr:hypothetical protein [Escherichia coli]